MRHWISSLLLSMAALNTVLAEMKPAPSELPPPPAFPQELLNRKPPQPPPNLPDPAELIGQLKQLDELLSLPDERLLRMRQTIELIEKMSKAEKETMRIRLAQVTRSTPELRSEISDFTLWLRDISKTDISQFWLAASAEQRAALRERMADLSPEAAAEVLRPRIEAFARHRDEAFASMQAELEARKSPPPSPQ